MTPGRDGDGSRPALVRFRPAAGAVSRAVMATVEIMAGVTLAHTWAGGTLPSLPGLALLAALVLGAGLLLFRGRTSLRVLVPVVAVAQVALHSIFEVAPADHHHHAADAGHLTWQMLLAHAVGTVLTVLVWSARQRAVEAIVTLVLLRPVPAPSWSVRPTAPLLDAGHPGRHLSSSVSLRGPPDQGFALAA